MSKLIFIFPIFLILSIYSNAEVEKKDLNNNNTIENNISKEPVSATRGDIKVIEASEDIRYLSQKIVKDYLYFYKYKNKIDIKRDLYSDLEKLSDKFRVIATTTRDSDTKDILEFLAYSKDQIEEIFNEEANDETAALMLDYSETLLEGADSIANSHKYNFSNEEQMLMTTKEMEYLLERLTKYYMAIHVGFDSSTNKSQMKDTMQQIENNLANINSYKYPIEFEQLQTKMNISWTINRKYFNKTNTLFIPKLMFISVNYLEDVIDKIALHHSKSQ